MEPQEKRRHSLDKQRESSYDLLKDTALLNIKRISQANPNLKDAGLVTPTSLNPLGLISNTKDPLCALYSHSTAAKIWGVSQRAIDKCTPPILYPEYTKPGATAYVYTEFDFWTSGFFPGSLYLLLERHRKHPHLVFPAGLSTTSYELQLQYACKWWTLNLHQNSRLTTTHDLGFMIAPWARKAWELDHDPEAYQTLITAAQTLVTRYNSVTKCLRSWDTCVTKRYSFTDPNIDFLVIIDNMLNLDLLFWTAVELGDQHFYNVAVAHAKTTQKHHIRPDSSTFHVVNFDQTTGAVKASMTNQGYSDSSCWSRGQSWAITGFAQTYSWTHDRSFLTTACNCADYFLANIPSNGVPPWDFSVPLTLDTPTDTSAAVVACYGMLLIHEALTELGEQSPYLKATLYLLTCLCETQLSAPAHFYTTPIASPDDNGASHDVEALKVDMGEGAETILLGATINNYKFAPRRWANHGLVYADYYFLLVGNKLLEMKVVSDLTS